jgi:hypothetical protein
MRSRKPSAQTSPPETSMWPVAWGRVRGIDIDARHPDGRRYVIEAKAEVGRNGPQQVNYFVGMLGELVQRMDRAGQMNAADIPATGAGLVKAYNGGDLAALTPCYLQSAR